MSEQQFFDVLLIAVFVMAILVFGALFLTAAPYGRHTRRGWGPQMNSTLGWVIMESPAVVVFALCFALGARVTDLMPLVFLVLWQVHYLHRTYVYPLRMRGSGKRMTVMVVALGFTFNAVNAYLNGRYIYTLGPGYSTGWLADPRFIVGVLLFLSGFGINLHSDGILRRLRGPGEVGYKLPRGGLFERVSCANYLGEVIEWCGWAVATWSVAGLAFAVWTAANLVPRALAHHRWYPTQFPDYPPQRKAIIPFLF